MNIKQDFTFIPNPQDGQLYILGDGRLNKLPFTIPQLVKASPCRSSDGLLYAGRLSSELFEGQSPVAGSKKDVWMRVDPEMGVKAVEAPQPEGENSFCPLEPSSVFIGRTVYRLSMKDSKRPDRQWNATFMDYSAALLPGMLAIWFESCADRFDADSIPALVSHRQQGRCTIASGVRGTQPFGLD